MWFYQGDIASEEEEEKKPKNPSEIHLRLQRAAKSFVTATGDPSTLLVQLWCTRTPLKGKTQGFHYLNHGAQ